MNKRVGYTNLDSIGKLFFLVVVFALLIPAGMVGQEEPTDGADKIEIPLSSLKLEELKHNQDSTGLVKEILQFFKFRENRNRKEKERLYYYIKELAVDSSNLSIDSTTTLKIIEQLEKISKELDTIRQKDFERHFSPVLPDLEIDYDEDEIAQRRAKQRAQINAEVISHEEESRNLYKSTDSAFDQLEKIIHGENSIFLIDKDVPQDSIVVGDSTLFYKHCLKPNATIIGWHNALKADKSENYNYNYLSAINYFGYELEANGSTRWPEYLKGDQKPEIIERAKAYGNDVFLTIYNKNRNEIAAFLKSNTAQETLIEELKDLRKNQIINGVNIYFEEVSLYQKDGFTAFLKELYHQINAVNMASDSLAAKPFKFAITIPAIVNQRSISKAKAFDFSALETFVDQYWMLTDRLIDLRKSVPQALSPLYQSRVDGGGTITSTVDYYMTEGIKKEKLIMTVSYSGVEWEISENGDLIGGKGKEITYGEILEQYKFNLDDTKLFSVERFDDKQATAYMSVTERDQNLNRRYKEIWYDDARSLSEKYKWVLDKGIGGVSIRELNNDNGDDKFGEEYLRLWKVLGASLVQIDTCWFKSKSNALKHIPKDSISYWSTFHQDFLIALVPNLEYRQPNAGREACQYVEEAIHRQDSISKVKLDTVSRRLWRWEYRQAIYKGEEKTFILENEEQCNCLQARWSLYTLIALISWSTFMFVMLLCSLVRSHLNRNKIEAKLVRKIIKIAFPLSFFLFVVFINLWFYLAPYIPLIGASAAGSNFWVLIFPSTFGMILGIILYRWSTKGRKESAKELP